MSKWKKFYEHLCNSPNNVRFEELRTFAERLGFSVRNKGSSHYIFSYDGADPVCVPKDGDSVKKIYVKKLVEAINELNLEIS